MSDKLTKIFATFFYIGYFPVAPGSLASFAALLIAVIFHKFTIIYILVTIAVTVIGFGVSTDMEKVAGKKDPSCVVIDEVSGMMISLFLLPLTPAVLITAFFLFRAFDMFKITPVDKLEEIEGGVGIMMDDVVAGIYTCVIMHIAVHFAGIA